jgi:hypothetical protein
VSMSDDQIAQIFGALGRIEQKIDGHVGTVAAHVDHDEKVQKALFERVEALQLAGAKQRGAAKVWSAVSVGAAGILGAAVGPVIEYFTRKHG